MYLQLSLDFGNGNSGCKTVFHVVPGQFCNDSAGHTPEEMWAAKGADDR